MSSIDTVSTTASTASLCRFNHQYNSNHHNRDYFVSRLVEIFQLALASLGVLSNSSGELNHEVVEKAESMSNFIYECMSNTARTYHVVQHVFDVIEANLCRIEDGSDEQPVLDAIAILAALFHDCVYSQVDGGLSAAQYEKLKGAIQQENDGTLKVTSSALDSGVDQLLCIPIFGIHEDRILSPSNSQNKLLSAIIAVRDLESILSKDQLVEIAVAIEATIPFRVAVDGKSALELLFDRLCVTVSDFGLNFSEDDCVSAVQRAALLANEDVGNFASTDHAWFLDHT